MHSCLYVGRVRHRRHAPRTARRSATAVHGVPRSRRARTGVPRPLAVVVRAPGAGALRGARTISATRGGPHEAVRDLVERKTGRRPARAHPAAHPPALFRLRLQSGELLLLLRSPPIARVETSSPRSTTRPGASATATCCRAKAGGADGALRFRFGKVFHVSPFMPMDIDYDWRFAAPGERLAVHMENFRDGRKLFDATLALERRALTGPALAGALVRVSVHDRDGDRGDLLAGAAAVAQARSLSHPPGRTHGRLHRRRRHGEDPMKLSTTLNAIAPGSTPKPRFLDTLARRAVLCRACAASRPRRTDPGRGRRHAALRHAQRGLSRRGRRCGCTTRASTARSPSAARSAPARPTCWATGAATT
jgi:uncharacterized protein